MSCPCSLCRSYREDQYRAFATLPMTNNLTATQVAERQRSVGKMPELGMGYGSWVARQEVAPRNAA